MNGERSVWKKARDWKDCECANILERNAKNKGGAKRNLYYPCFYAFWNKVSTAENTAFPVMGSGVLRNGVRGEIIQVDETFLFVYSNSSYLYYGTFLYFQHLYILLNIGFFLVRINLSKYLFLIVSTVLIA